MAVVGVPTASAAAAGAGGRGRAFVLVEDLIGEHVAELFFSGDQAPDRRLSRDAQLGPRHRSGGGRRPAGAGLGAACAGATSAPRSGSSSPPTRPARSPGSWCASTSSQDARRLRGRRAAPAAGPGASATLVRGARREPQGRAGRPRASDSEAVIDSDGEGRHPPPPPLRLVRPGGARSSTRPPTIPTCRPSSRSCTAPARTARS